MDDDHVTSALAQNSAVRAFEELRGEISLLRRGIEGLTAERQHQPDYGPTLESLATSNGEIREWARKISERPAIKLTPQAIGEQIEGAVVRFRDHDRQVLKLAEGRLEEASKDLQSRSRNALTAAEQVRKVKIAGGSAFLGGVLLTLLFAQVEMIWR